LAAVNVGEPKTNIFISLEFIFSLKNHERIFVLYFENKTKLFSIYNAAVENQQRVRDYKNFCGLKQKRHVREITKKK
jgi:hypothetical protein